ncbi:hypothetical protein, partial [Arthrobacter pigmenti]
VTVPDDATEGTDYLIRGIDTTTGDAAEAPFEVLAPATGGETCSAKTAITIDPSTVAPGGTVTISGVGFTPGQLVTIRISNDGMELFTPSMVPTVAIGEDCAFSLEVTVPAGAVAGDYEVVADGGDDNSASATITITDPAGNDGAGSGNDSTDEDNDSNGGDDNASGSVAGDDNGSGSGDLAYTGSTAGLVSLLALILLAGGAVLLYGVANRRHSRQV